MSRSRLVFGLLAAFGAACQTRTDPPPRRLASSTLSLTMIDSLALLATGKPADPAVLAAVQQGRMTLDAYLDALVHERSFAHEVIPQVILGELDLVPVTWRAYQRILSTETVDGQELYFLDKVCKVTDSVEVSPWWDPKQPVWICVGDYKPAARRTANGNGCTGSMSLGDPACGCGPSLINCMKDGKQKLAVTDSLYRESVDTIAYITEQDSPFEDVFTTAYSFRDRNAEYMRLRDKVYAGFLDQVPDLSSWPQSGQWAPREELWPGAHAGILTTDQYLYMSDGPRDRMRLVFARTWCATPGSFGVDSAQFTRLVADHANIRNNIEGWHALAAAPGCSSCHARMDYGAQFFLPYLASGTSMSPRPELSRHSESGPMYLTDIDDPRGEAALTPHALGEIIVHQPEFGQCMVTRVSDYVLGDEATPTQKQALLDVFTRTGQMRPLVTAALRMYAARGEGSAPPPAGFAQPVGPARSGTAAPADLIAIAAPLASRLEEHCGDCHDSGDHAFLANLATGTLPRETVIEMANLVASDLMPKDHPMPGAEQRELLGMVIDSMAPDATWAANARAYWIDNFRGSPSYPYGTIKRRIAKDASYTLSPEDNNPSIEENLEGKLVTLTPSLVTEAAQLALEACKPLAADRERHRECLRRETQPALLLRP